MFQGQNRRLSDEGTKKHPSNRAVWGFSVPGGEEGAHRVYAARTRTTEKRRKTGSPCYKVGRKGRGGKKTGWGCGQDAEGQERGRGRMWKKMMEKKCWSPVRHQMSRNKKPEELHILMELGGSDTLNCSRQWEKFRSIVKRTGIEGTKGSFINPSVEAPKGRKAQCAAG